MSTKPAADPCVRMHRVQTQFAERDTSGSSPCWSCPPGVVVDVTPIGQTGAVGERAHDEGGPLWMQRVAELNAFVGSHGRFPDIGDAVHLIEWVRLARLHYPTGQLPVELVVAVEQIPGWAWDPPPRRRTGAGSGGGRWVERAKLIAEFVTVNGYLPGDGHGSGDDDELADWVHRIRSRYAKGELSLTAATVVAGLPGWSWELPARQPRASWGSLSGSSALRRSVRSMTLQVSSLPPTPTCVSHGGRSTPATLVGAASHRKRSWCSKPSRAGHGRGRLCVPRLMLSHHRSVPIPNRQRLG